MYIDYQSLDYKEFIFIFADPVGKQVREMKGPDLHICPDEGKKANNEYVIKMWYSGLA